MCGYKLSSGDFTFLHYISAGLVTDSSSFSLFCSWIEKKIWFYNNLLCVFQADGALTAKFYMSQNTHYNLLSLCLFQLWPLFTHRRVYCINSGQKQNGRLLLLHQLYAQKSVKAFECYMCVCVCVCGPCRWSSARYLLLHQFNIQLSFQSLSVSPTYM